MDVDREALEAAVRRGIITAAQADALWAHLREAGRLRPVDGPSLRSAVPLALGLALAGAAGLHLARSWSAWGSAAGLVLSAAAVVLLAAGIRATRARASTTLVVALVALVPFVVHAALHAAGAADPHLEPTTFGAWLGSHDPACLLATAIALGFALRWDGSPSLSAGAALLTWLCAMSLAPLVFGPSSTWEQRALLSAMAGLVVLAVGFALDHRTRADHAGWLYLGGMVSIAGGLGTLPPGGPSTAAVKALVFAWFVVLGFLLGRRSFAVVGALGLTAVIGNAADDLLVREAFVAVLLVLVGCLVGGAVLYRRLEPLGRPRALARLPAFARRLLPPA